MKPQIIRHGEVILQPISEIPKEAKLEKENRKTLLVRNHSQMVCALPEEAYQELREAIVGVFLKYRNKATDYQWTMSDDIKNKELETLYAKYPEDRGSDFLEELEEATAISFELYGNDKDNFWCDNKEQAEKIVNNEQLRKKAKKQYD